MLINDEFLMPGENNSMITNACDLCAKLSIRTDTRLNIDRFHCDVAGEYLESFSIVEKYLNGNIARGEHDR